MSNWFDKKLGTPAPQVYVEPARQYVKPEHRMPSNYQTSPDGLWLWNGAEWIPNDQQRVPAPPPSPPQALSEKTARAKAVQDRSSGTCPQCGIDDTFMSGPNAPVGSPKRCFSCGFSEAATAQYNSTAFGSSAGQAATPARHQSGGGWTPPTTAAGLERLQL